MSRFLTLLKMNCRLLFRNRGFFFFLCVPTIVSAIILGLKSETTVYENEIARTEIIELENSSDKAIYVGDTTAYIIKVYDASHSGLSEYLLESFTKTGMFSVCRADVSNLSQNEVLEQAKKDAFDDRAGTLLYIKEGFEACALNGDYKGALQVYSVSEDERWEMFKTHLKDRLSQIHGIAGSVGINSSRVLEVLESVEDVIPRKEVISLSGKEEIVLTHEQNDKKTLIGYAFAIITLGFLFCGVCVAYTVIEEQNNKVYSRAMLSRLTGIEYLCSKFVMTVMISIAQTLLLGMILFAVKGMDFGINKFSLLLMIFCLGLVFSTISLIVGVLLGDVMSANYAVFTVWSISALLAGLYFPLDSTSSMLKAMSNLMPQRWFMKATEMLFVGDKEAFSMILYITMAYLIVIISIGSIGLKMKRNEA